MRIEDPRTVIKVPRESMKKLEVHKAMGKTRINGEKVFYYDRVRGTCRVQAPCRLKMWSSDSYDTLYASFCRRLSTGIFGGMISLTVRQSIGAGYAVLACFSLADPESTRQYRCAGLLLLLTKFLPLTILPISTLSSLMAMWVSGALPNKSRSYMFAEPIIIKPLNQGNGSLMMTVDLCPF